MWQIEIVRRCDKHRFAEPHKRWIVERALGGISRNRCPGRDFERPIGIAAAFVRIARSASCSGAWPQTNQPELELHG
jgi:hypothetical protein